MRMDPGARLGPFEIIAPLGAGGMGEVYRARDTRLGREVAIKVLPQHLSSQPEVRARFEREAKTVSGLNHPNICTLFDVGREGDTDYLVMELIEGDTLAERLKRGPLSTGDLLRYGTQIADALDRAHRAGVIHRDLKPGNIMMTRAGAKLMDFGLARATGLAGAAGSGTLAALSQSPTAAHPLTAEGTIVGTFQYMSPEQLEGKEADARSDIWALGCVLYEMATGRRAFEGRSQASLIAAILEREPAVIGEAPPASGAVMSGGAPPGLDRLIRNCLTKDPEERIQTAHDVKLQLQGIAEGVGLSSASVISAPIPAALPARPRAGAARLAWGVAMLGLLAAAGMFAWLYPRTHVPASASFRFRIITVPNTTDTYWPRVSPDGKFLLTQAVDSTGTRRAYLCPMNQVDAHPIPGTEGLQRAYWSFDSREIVFVADGKMQRLALAGGSPVTVCAAPGGADLSWGAKGLVLMDGSFTDSLRVVPAGGGELKPASRIDRAAKEVGSAWPCFLPDGKHFLFIGNLAATNTGGNIRLGTIGSLDSRLLGRSDGRVEYAPGGWVLFVRGATLLAQKLDLGGAKLTGEPITVADNIRVGSASGHYSISQTGVLAFSRQIEGDEVVLRTAGRDGVVKGAPLAAGTLINPRPSPDGRRLLYQLTGRSGITGEIHVLDLERATDTRLTFTGDQALLPEWSPDGRRFAFVIRGAGGDRLHLGAADGLGGQDSILVPASLGVTLFQWSTAGSRLLFSSGQFKGFAVASEGSDRTPKPLPDSTLLLAQQQMSPDGRWLAYATGTGSNVNVYVQSLEGPPGRWQISNKPAIRPRWTRGGREIVYEGLDGRLMAVDIDTQNGFHAGTPHALFALPEQSPRVDQASWACDANGEQFYVVVPPKIQRAGSIEVVTAFHELVSRK
jgi:eukaryotic-like serine/threonine-protein kinase